jgi:selenophosphate synthetase-related protein
VALPTWLTTFPSYGFLLSVPPDAVSAVQAAARDRELTCEAVGTVDGSGELRVARGGIDSKVLWDLSRKPYAGFGRPAT